MPDKIASQRKKSNQLSAPPAAGYEFVELITPADVKTWAATLGEQCNEADLAAHSDYLNEAISDFLRDVPGTVGREADRRRHAWFDDVARTSDHLRRLHCGV